MNENKEKMKNRKIDKIIEICDFLTRKLDINDQVEVLQEIINEVQDIKESIEYQKACVKAGILEQIKSEKTKGDLEVVSIDPNRRQLTMVIAIRKILDDNPWYYSDAKRDEKSGVWTIRVSNVLSGDCLGEIYIHTNFTIHYHCYKDVENLVHKTMWMAETDTDLSASLR